MRTVAPAKINWTLEVLGRRDDGYHEIRSVMQTIDLCDELEVSSAPELLERAKLPTELPPGTSVLRGSPHDFRYAAYEQGPSGGVLGETVIRAVQLLDPEWQKGLRASLTKRIPISAGLGGGSSDAAAAIRGLNTLWQLEADRASLDAIGIEIGSDVVFFLTGGTALVAGRGERVMPLPDVHEVWLVLVVPPTRLPEKTKQMYEALEGEDFSDGTRSEALAGWLRTGRRLRKQDLYNAFERVAYKVFEGLQVYRDALLTAGASGAHVAGAGPTLFALSASESGARDLADRIHAPDAKVLVARTLPAVEATAIVE
jgi:4-diphosphocytidyl-2-C-methyl-D-erythritol kinase